MVLVFGTSRGTGSSCKQVVVGESEGIWEKRTKGTTWHNNMYAFVFFEMFKYYILYIDMYSIRYELLDVDLTKAWITSLAKVVFGI